MKLRIIAHLFFLIVVGFQSQLALAEAPKTEKPKLYDESADGTKQIADALVIAKKENKRILLQFGANWCGWCHKLHHTFETDKAIAAILKANYVVVLIDVNKSHNADVNKKYGNPMQFGLPAIVLLDSDGKQLTTKNTAELEAGKNHDPEKVLLFLRHWAAKQVMLQ